MLLTRDSPPVTGRRAARGHRFAVEPAPGGDPIPRPRHDRRRGADPGTALVHDLPHGLVVEPQDEVSAYLDVTHPEQLAADEDKVERLKRERR